MVEATRQETPTGPLPIRPEIEALRPASRSRSLAWAALLVAGLFSIPIVSVLVNIFVPSQGTWQHLAREAAATAN